MITFVLIEEYRSGGSLLIAADLDEETLKKQKEEFEKVRNDSYYRIAQIEVTNKRRLIGFT